MHAFYVYAHYKEDPTFNLLAIPYYIGKGIKNRWKKITGRTKQHLNIIKKYGLWVKKLYENLTENEAFNIEKEEIKKYGRQNIGTGPLINLTDGGEGASGLIFPEKSKEALRKARQRQLSDPEWVTNWKKALNIACETVEYKERQSVLKKELYENKPEIKKKISRKMKILYSLCPEISKKQGESRTLYWKNHPDEYLEFQKRRIASVKTDETREKNRQARIRYYEDEKNLLRTKESNLKARGKLTKITFHDGSTKERFGVNDLAVEIGVNKGQLKAMARGTYPGHSLTCKNEGFKHLKIIKAEYI